MRHQLVPAAEAGWYPTRAASSGIVITDVMRSPFGNTHVGYV
jgi:hypothetical protein